MDEFLSGIFTSQWRVLAFVSILLLLLAEFGFRLGGRVRQRLDEGNKVQVGALEAAVLGLLALLLGFTFAMAVQRYDARRALVVQEANSIGTTYLRAAFLPDPHRVAVEDLLRRYVDVRLEYRAAAGDRSRIAAAVKATADLHRQLWTHATAAGREAPSPLVAAFVTALNETIDLDASRLAAARNRVPGAVWLLVLLVAGCGTCACGYADGANGRRLAFAQIILPLLIAVVITILVDLDNPIRGLIATSQQSLVDLKESLAVQPPSVP